MSFELWLFAVKQLAQTYEVAGRIYEQLSDEEKKRLRAEYTAQTGIKLEDEPPKDTSVVIDLKEYEPMRVAETMRCERLCHQINASEPDSTEYRRFVHELFGSSIGLKSKIDIPFHVDLADHVLIGNNVLIMHDFTCVSYGKVTIGDNVRIAPHCKIITADFDFRDHDVLICKPVVIKANVCIGAGSTILSGVTIGENAYVGAGSMVTSDVLANSVVYGCPAKVRRQG